MQVWWPFATDYSAAVLAGLDVLSLAAFVGVEAENDVPEPADDEAVGDAHPDVEPHPVLPDPSGGVLLLGAAHVAEAREGSHEDDGEEEQAEGVTFTEADLVEAGVVVVFASLEEAGA